jgi:hypothetical protein
MSDVRRGLTLLAVLLAMMAGLAGGAAGQTSSIPTTTVQDTVYSANGTPASGTVLVSWSAFTTASGASVPAGSTSVTIGAGGVLTIALAPNAGATPIGSYYTAILHLSDGTTSRQYWVVPVAIPGGGPAKLAAIQNQVLPTSVAMQTVSKQYVDNAIAAAVTGTPTNASPYVLKAGDTMTGPLVLPADPVSPNQAADKGYVDENVAAIAGGVGQKVSLLPSTTQVIAQPSGTQLQVNNLNGDLYASQYVSGAGNNGIANALASAGCTSGCTVEAEPTYSSNELTNSSAMASNTDVVDQRGGDIAETAVNPLAPLATFSSAASITTVETLSAPQLQALRPGAIGIGTAALSLTTQGLAGGSNQFPSGIEQPPYFKNTYGVLQMEGIYNTQGQHVQTGNDVYCYAVGDCLAGGQFIYSSGGYGGMRSQEFAEDAETCFRATGSCCFDAEAIERRLLKLAGREAVETRRGGALQIWFRAIAGREYVVGVDSAGGGEDGDFAAVQGIDRATGLQCAELQQRLRPVELARAAVELAREYRSALVGVERNNHGATVLAYIETSEHYGHVYKQRREVGWLTTAASKPEMVARIGSLLQQTPELFLSRRLLAECRTYVASENGRTAAAGGEHDDLVMAMAVAQAVRAEGPC